MSDNSTADSLLLTKLTFFKPSYTINFHNGTEVVGRLDFNGPKMTFEGDADASVELFVKALSHWFDGRLRQEREAEREACARLCEKMETYGDPVQGWLDYCAEEIRKRGKP